MNHIYRSIWDEALGTWIAVSENAKSKGKSGSKSRKLLATGLLLCSSSSWGLPTDGQVVAGQVNISNPSAAQMNINQSTQKAIVNWNGFSIAPTETVNIQQPNVSAVLLNRVVGMDASVIQGNLNANGQVYLVNPNGVLFSNTAQVDVGGLIASTHNISNADFLNGNNHFTQDGATGSVSNQGSIKVPAGGTVALIGTQVSNSGTIETPQGTTALAAGKTVDLDFKGNGLVEVKVPEAALNAQIANSGAILADGGRVVLTAQAANQLASTVINQSGLIQAKSLTSRNGEIFLDGGDNGTVQLNGTMNVSGQTAGGTIDVTGKDINLNSSANLVAQALNSGTAGTIKVIGDMIDGLLNVAGKLDASAFGTAKGGFIETSAAHVNIADSAKITTKAASGNSGIWLIDPNDFTIAASGGNMTGAALGSQLDNNSYVSILTYSMGTPGGNGDIFVNDAISWSSSSSLQLFAERNIYINADIIATGVLLSDSYGTTPALELFYGQAFQLGNPTANYFIDPSVTITLPDGYNFRTQNGQMTPGTYYYNYEHIGTGNGTKDEVFGGIFNGTNMFPPPPPPPHNEDSHEGFGQFQRSPVADEGGFSPSSAPALFDSALMQQSNRQIFEPTFSIKNSAGQIQDLELSADKQFLSLLLEDGSVRIWDLQQGVQRQVNTEKSNFALTGIGGVDSSASLQAIVTQAGIDLYDVISSTADKTINAPDVRHFASSNDSNLLLINTGRNNLFLWDSKQDQKLWQTVYQRGEIKQLAVADNKRYGAVLGRQQGAYIVADKLRSLTDAIDIFDLETGKIIKSLPNLRDDVVSMKFKNNETLQLGLASGEMLDWDLGGNNTKIVMNFAEPIVTVDTAGDNYAYLLKDGTVRVANTQNQIQLNIQNKSNPFKQALLLENGKKLLTTMASGDLSLWDVATGKKMLNLFSTQQGGWTVMDAYGRFDGSEKALENFSWVANEDEISLSSFSENYYEPGLLANVLRNQDYLNSNPNAVLAGISLPPKINLQLASLETTADKVAVQMDVFDRGGGINKINVYHNGRILSDEHIVKTAQPLEQQDSEHQDSEHQAFMINITPTAGKNTLRVSANNEMGIENNSAELNFDGKTKAFTSALKLLTVGINEYSDSRMNLNYSVPDAKLIQEVLKNNSKLTFNRALFNKDATKAKILAELKELSQGSQQDVIVVYLAGHGLAVGKEWSFVPYETKLTNEEEVAANGVTATELSEIFKNSKVQHILLMVDACYSGAGMGAFSQLQNSQRHFSRQLSRSLGITVVTAASKDQQAIEATKLGHGLFTYLMAQELQNSNTNQPVTAHGIAKKIGESLPVFSKKTVGTSQEPVAYTHGNDFILTGSATAEPPKSALGSKVK